MACLPSETGQILELYANVIVRNTVLQIGQLLVEIVDNENYRFDDNYLLQSWGLRVSDSVNISPYNETHSYLQIKFEAENRGNIGKYVI